MLALFFSRFVKFQLLFNNPQITAKASEQQVNKIVELLQAQLSASQGQGHEIRFYSLYAAIANQNIKNHEICKTKNCLKAVFDHFETDDLLELLNVIELIDQVKNLQKREEKKPQETNFESLFFWKIIHSSFSL